MPLKDTVICESYNTDTLPPSHFSEFTNTSSVMEQHLFLFLFFTGVLHLVLSRTYYLIQEGKTWSDAQAYCRTTYTDLAIIRSTEDMTQFQNEAQAQLFSSSAWIGLYLNINSWRWSFGDEILGSMTQWASDDPNNNGGVQECAIIDMYSWNDRDCTEQWPFVCFDETKTGADRYIYISTEMTWSDAQSYCRATYTDLASARDATENSIIQGLTFDYTWFGLFRDSWKWTDQTNFSTISWVYGEPDNYLGDENCGYIDNGEAADAQCSDILPFFCYSDLVIPTQQTTAVTVPSTQAVTDPTVMAVNNKKQQIMRVKVQSNQDVNDPAVKAAILEEITQKLESHGMAETITVKWREQPDGKVFHKEKEKEEF
ncbi:putative C-type lectin domain family 20 member A [Ictalurus punctatus]|uniref:C-type lectin domain family 20 member A n=1 Tax=Ictalurus punctatus TaxID=7998 RepID=A0A2D0PXJ1_ICTPU|nr:putative C-type lectin domain family 20 member A [Ictalurus punctatus]